MPDPKKISPNIASAHGLSGTKSLPKMPRTPSTKPTKPTNVKMNAIALIIENGLMQRRNQIMCLLKDRQFDQHLGLNKSV
jgi:hypothetical protein